MTNLRLAVLALLVVFSIACDNFKLNPTSPSPISGNSGGPELRIHPNLGSDLQRMFTNPEEWVEARSKLGVFQFHHGNVGSFSCPTCTTSGGMTNTFQDLANIGAFRKLTEWGIPTSVEIGFTKHHNCEVPEVQMRAAVDSAIQAVSNIKSAGGRVVDVSMDEPFMGGMLRFEWDGQNVSGCEYTPEKTAQITLDYGIRPFQAAHPDVQVGLTEAYPTFDVEALKRNILALESIGYHLPFLHIDYDRNAVIREDQNFFTDMHNLQAFLHSQNIKMGVVIWGERGMSNELWISDAEAMAIQWRNALGNTPDRVIIESWSRAVGSNTFASTNTQPHYFPNNLPENQPSMTYMINQMSLFFR